MIDIYFGNGEVYPAELPTVRDLAKRIIAMKREFPQTDLLFAKRDIESSFRLIRIHPHLANVMVTEFAGHHFGLDEDVLLFYGVLPFGWEVVPVTSVGSSMRSLSFTNYTDRLTPCGTSVLRSDLTCISMTDWL